MGLMFQKTGKKIIRFADADWRSCSVDRRSYTGYCFLLTVEAEYIFLTEASKEAIHLKDLAMVWVLKKRKF